MSKPKRHRKRTVSPFKVETFLFNYGLQTAGILLIIGGLAYLVFSNFNSQFLSEFWSSFTHSKPEKSFIPSQTRSTLPGYLSLLLYVPGILLLVIPHFLRGRSIWVKNLLVSLGFIWLIATEGKVLLDIRYHNIELNYYLLLASFCLIQIIAISVSIAGKNRFAMSWSVFYFFASVIFIRFIYGVILPNIIMLIFLQIAVSLSCFSFKWRSPFILLMTFSTVYISYYFIKLAILPPDAARHLTYMQPGVLVWFILSVTGFGILKPEPDRKILKLTWNYLPYATLLIITGLTLGFYLKSGINSLFFLWYAFAVMVLIAITVLNRKYTFIRYGDPFYLSVSVFTAFLLPQLFYDHFFLILSACLAVALLINVMLTGLKINLQLSVGLFAASLGLYLADWALKIIPALVSQATSGTMYSLQMLFPGLLLFALAYFYSKLFTHLLSEYSFSYTQTKKYKNIVSLVYNVVLYLTFFLVVDYLLILIIPGYRVNFIEWGLYTYSFIYFFSRSQNLKSRTRLWYVLLLTLPAIILYPAVIHPEAIHFRTLFLAGESFALLPFIMHYFSLGVLILVILNVNERLRLLYPRSQFITNSRMLLGIVFLCFILLSEYDNLLLLLVNRFSSEPAYEILQYNKFIPYSVILLLISFALLIYSLIRYTRFLRRLSMFMILAVLLKVLFIDITILPANTSIILLISLGAILVALSFLIPRFRKQSNVDKLS